MEDKFLRKASAILFLIGIFIGASVWYGSESELMNTSLQQTGSTRDVTTIAPAAETAGFFASPFKSSASSPAITSITGRWGGEIDIGSGNKALFNFNIREAEGLLAGTATFPIGEGSIENGIITNNQLTFATRHRLPSSGQAVVTKFSGTVGDNIIVLSMLSEGGESKLTLNPMPR